MTGAIAVIATLWVWSISAGNLGPPGQDIDNFVMAGRRVLVGDELYVNTIDANKLFAYAPWFAWIWAAVASLPRTVVSVTWLALCFLAWMIVVWALRRQPAAALLIGAMTFYGAWVGNPQPMMGVALLAFRRTRWEPVSVGVLASLKISPILLAAYWIITGRSRAALVATAVGAVLWLPALLYGIESFPMGVIISPMALWSRSPLIAAACVGAAIAAAWLAPRRYARLACATAAIASRPTLLTYDVSYLLFAWPRRDGRPTTHAPIRL